MTPAQPLIPFFTQRPTDSGAAAASPAQKAPRESDELVTAIWVDREEASPLRLAARDSIPRAARGSSSDLRKR